MLVECLNSADLTLTDLLNTFVQVEHNQNVSQTTDKSSHLFYIKLTKNADHFLFLNVHERDLAKYPDVEPDHNAFSAERLPTGFVHDNTLYLIDSTTNCVHSLPYFELISGAMKDGRSFLVQQKSANLSELFNCHHFSLIHPESKLDKQVVPTTSENGTTASPNTTTPTISQPPTSDHPAEAVKKLPKCEPRVLLPNQKDMTEPYYMVINTQVEFFKEWLAFIMLMPLLAITGLCAVCMKTKHWVKNRSVKASKSELPMKGVVSGTTLTDATTPSNAKEATTPAGALAAAEATVGSITTAVTKSVATSAPVVSNIQSKLASIFSWAVFSKKSSNKGSETTRKKRKHKTQMQSATNGGGGQQDISQTQSTPSSAAGNSSSVGVSMVSGVHGTPNSHLKTTPTLAPVMTSTNQSTVGSVTSEGGGGRTSVASFNSTGGSNSSLAYPYVASLQQPNSKHGTETVTSFQVTNSSVQTSNIHGSTLAPKRADQRSHQNGPVPPSLQNPETVRFTPKVTGSSAIPSTAKGYSDTGKSSFASTANQSTAHSFAPTAPSSAIPQSRVPQPSHGSSAIQPMVGNTSVAGSNVSSQHGPVSNVSFSVNQHK